VCAVIKLYAGYKVVVLKTTKYLMNIPVKAYRVEFYQVFFKSKLIKFQ